MRDQSVDDTSNLQIDVNSMSLTSLTSTVPLINSPNAHDAVRVADIISRHEVTIRDMQSEFSARYTSLTTLYNIALASLECEREKTKIYTDLFSKELEYTHDTGKLMALKNNTHISAKNINMGTLNLSAERLAPLRDTFTLDHYNRGGIGSADWAVDNILTDEAGRLVYRCTDKNRKQFVYRDESGNNVTDVNATRLKAVILPLMRDKILEYKRLKYTELADLSDDDNSITDSCRRVHQEHTVLGLEFERRLVQKTYTNDTIK